MSNDQEDSDNTHEDQAGDLDLAGSYVNYIRARRGDLTGTVTGAMAKLGLLVPGPERKPDHTNPQHEAQESPAEAIKRQRAHAKQGTAVNAITLHGKVIEPINAGGVLARLQKQRYQGDEQQQPEEKPTPSAPAKGNARVQADSRGRVNTVLYPNNQSRKFEFNEQGELSSVIDKDGSVLKKTSSYGWTIIDKAGKASKEVRATIDVDSDGTYSFIDEEAGTVITETTDGTTLKELADGYKIAEHADGSRIVLCPDGARMQLMPDGTMVTETDSGLLSQKPNGICIETDRDRRVTRLERSDKRSRDLKYIATGEVLELKDADGFIWYKIPGEIWVQFTHDAQETGLRFAVTISVDEDGTITYSEETTGTTAVEKPDGKVHFSLSGQQQHEISIPAISVSKILAQFFTPLAQAEPVASESNSVSATEPAAKEKSDTREDGCRLEMDSAGQLAAFTTPAGRTFKIAAPTRAKYTTQENDSLDEIAADAVRLQKWSQLNIEPGDAEIRAVRDRILRLNASISFDNLRAGEALTIPR